MIIILTTLYNAEKYIDKCINSILNQSYKDFKCYITDDMSTDNSVLLVKEIIKNDDRFILIENKIKLYQSGNYDQVIRNNSTIDDMDIIIEVDGDDWLPDNDTLNRINQVYLDENVWIANGRFKYSTGNIGFSSKQRIDENLRYSDFTASHIRTWRAFLWRKINVDDLKDENGHYWSIANDLAFMFPMLEMSGEEHYRFMSDINYIYNEENPINEHKVDIDKVIYTANKIRSKKKYDKL
jgi:glycosyltransferase involved in cell wall biosynthesis